MNHYSKRDGQCLFWTGTQAGGYGLIGVSGNMVGAHRAAYTEWVGPIPDGHDIDHICFNRACIEPSHLRTVSRKQNMEHLSGAYVNSKTGVRGVYFWEARGVYVARIWHNGRKHRQGYFPTLEEADNAVRSWRSELYTHDDAVY